MEGIGPIAQGRVVARMMPGGERGDLATNHNSRARHTAICTRTVVKRWAVRVTRIASGLPVGGDLEYADELTLGRALEGRRDVEL